MADSMKKFHAHLDACKKCRENPFGLCKPGEALLRASADDDAISIAKRIYSGVRKS